MKYIVKFEEYKEKIIIEQVCEDWKSAQAVQTMLSSIAEQKKWTRHRTCTSIVRHMDIISDLYNEGSIMVEPSKQSELSINNTEVRNQPHDMWAEGSEDFLMTELQVREFVASKLNYTASNIDIYFDRIQCVFRWQCDIK